MIEVLRYFQENAWAIVFLLIGGYYVKGNMLEPWMQGRQSRLDVNPDRTVKLREEMLKVRLEQQEVSSNRAIAAEKIRKEKEREEKKRKNEKSLHKNKIGGNRLGQTDDATTNTTSSSRFNALQPWASNSSGYRHQRRQDPRSGG